MPFLSYEIDIGPACHSLLTFASLLHDRIDDAVEQTAEESLARVKSGAYWKNRSGATAASFGDKPTRTGFASYRVQSRAKVATYLDKGTKPHDIVATKAKALRFVQNGAVRFAKRVHHPGTRPIGYEATEAAVCEPVLFQRAERAAEIAASLAGA